eukprot:TRINITY_DN2943_c0_g2_i1.p1 TRINITY_DN2943_c0_g2~~TRINITY_DN2943_c0_g2_i1.p1  ORF type:complete len:859 (+),score=148.98 TRINITY_DN2943_c0_g2_i1:164-2740(+)
MDNNNNNMDNNRKGKQWKEMEEKEWIEFEKGIRSGNIGIQCERIIMMSRLFTLNSSQYFNQSNKTINNNNNNNEKDHLNSLFISNVLLRFADLFRSSNNFIRFVLFKSLGRIFQSNLTKRNNQKNGSTREFKQNESTNNQNGEDGKEREEEKWKRGINNLDEIVKRINSVLMSNDPIARAITLRTLGKLSEIVGDRINIHHGIRKCVESQQREELEAAIYAIENLCKNSPYFSQTMISKLKRMILSFETPMEAKLKMVCTLKHMHSNPQSSQQTRYFCLELLSTHPTIPFVSAILDTLTLLSEKSLFQIGDQISLLIKITKQDQRKSIRSLAIDNLISLAKNNSYQDFKLSELLNLVSLESNLILSSFGFNELVSFMQDHIQLVEKLLLLITILSKSEYQISHFMKDVEWISVIENLALSFSHNSIIVSHCSEILINFLEKKPKEIFDYHRLVICLSSILTRSILQSEEDDSFHWNQCIAVTTKSLGRMIIFRPLFSQTIILNLLKLFSLSVQNKKAFASVSILESICFCIEHSSISSYFKKNSYQLEILYQSVNQVVGGSFCQDTMMPLLFRSLYGLHQPQGSESPNESFSTCLDLLINWTIRSQQGNLWMVYRIIVESISHGFHWVAHKLIEDLSMNEKVDSWNFREWVNALKDIAEAEMAACSLDFSESIRLLSLSLFRIQISNSCGFKFNRTIRFLALRISFLENVMLLQNIVGSLQVDNFEGPLKDQFSFCSTTFRSLSKELVVIRKDFPLKSRNYFALFNFHMMCLLFSALIDYSFRGDTQSLHSAELLPLKYDPNDQTKFDADSSSVFLSCSQVLRELKRNREKSVQQPNLYVTEIMSAAFGYPPFFFHSD